jgi:hypothetical protein
VENTPLRNVKKECTHRPVMTAPNSEAMDKTTRNIYCFRSAHALFAVFFILCLVDIYYSAITRTHAWHLFAALSALLAEGLVVALNRGQCPLTGLQHRLGDQKGFFNLFLPDVIAKYLVPFWFCVALVGFLLLWMRC